MRTLYLIPGLGTDHRIFQRLVPLLGWQGAVEYLDYLDPTDPREPMPAYAARLAANIPADAPEKPVIVGMSLGGMVAVELAKLVPHARLILISSIKCEAEVPLYFKLLRAIPAYNLLPANFSKKLGAPIGKWMGIFKDAEGAELYNQMLRARTDAHLDWGRRAAIWWKNETPPADCIHIHGDRDHIFSHKRVKYTHLIPGGTHYLVIDRAAELAELMKPYLVF